MTTRPAVLFPEQVPQFCGQHVPNGLVDKGLFVATPVGLQEDVEVPGGFLFRQLPIEKGLLGDGEVAEDPEQDVEKLFILFLVLFISSGVRYGQWSLLHVPLFLKQIIVQLWMF